MLAIAICVGLFPSTPRASRRGVDDWRYGERIQAAPEYHQVDSAVIASGAKQSNGNCRQQLKFFVARAHRNDGSGCCFDVTRHIYFHDSLRIATTLHIILAPMGSRAQPCEFPGPMRTRVDRRRARKFRGELRSRAFAETNAT